jgi:hypothetical protein
MTGQSTCREIQDIRERGRTNRHAQDCMASINPIKGIGDAVNSKNDSDNVVVNLIRQNFKNIQSTMIKNNCSNVSSLKQENRYKEDPICFTALIGACAFKNEQTNIECVKEVLAFLKNRPELTQTNKNVTTALCEINAAIQVIASQEASAQNAAILQSMQEAKGLLTNNKQASFNCSEIDQNISSEQYLKVLLECIAEDSVQQSNIVEGCYPNVTAQLNDNSGVSKCLLSAGVLQSSAQTAAASNKGDISVSQTATGLDIGASLASLTPILIICAIVVIGAIVVFPMMG